MRLQSDGRDRRPQRLTRQSARHWTRDTEERESGVPPRGGAPLFCCPHPFAPRAEADPVNPHLDPPTLVRRSVVRGMWIRTAVSLFLLT